MVEVEGEMVEAVEGEMMEVEVPVVGGVSSGWKENVEERESGEGRKREEKRIPIEGAKRMIKKEKEKEEQGEVLKYTQEGKVMEEEEGKEEVEEEKELSEQRTQWGAEDEKDKRTENKRRNEKKRKKE